MHLVNINNSLQITAINNLTCLDNDEFIINVDVERFSYNNLFQDFKFIKSIVKIGMDV